MPQTSAWEKEYKNPKLITNSNEPQVAFKDFVKWLRRKEGIDLAEIRSLDLGSGTGKNSIYLAERGSFAVGLEISAQAVKMAKERASEVGVQAEFLNRSFGEDFPFDENTFDLVVDSISSNSLNDKEREVYIKEVARVLKSGGYMYVRALCKDGDKNALNLLKMSPGKEHNTYVMKDIGLVERVFSKADFIKIYEPDFEILKMDKTSNYTSFGGKSYKRNFWIAYLKRK